MNEYFITILPLIIIVVIFFIISILLFKYLGVSFQTNNKKVLKRVITVETYNNNKYDKNNII